MKPTKTNFTVMLRKWAQQHDVDITDTSVYSKKEWDLRGEDYGNDADIVMTSEGELNEILNGYVRCELYSSLTETIGNLYEDYYLEHCTHWYYAIYKI